MKKLLGIILTAFWSVLFTLQAFTSFAVAVVLAMLGYAFAQDLAPAVSLAQVPDYIWAVASPAIGWLVKEVASPLTSLLKKRIGFQGDITRYVYIVLTTTFAVGYGLLVHAYGAGSASWWTALGAYVTAIIKGFGGYQLQVDAAKAGSSSALPVIVGDVLPPAGVIDAPSLPVAPSGIEPLPVKQGLLSLPQLDLTAVIGQVLGQAFKGAVPDGFPGAFAVKLAPIVPELLDGDLYLSAAGRNRILDVILDAKGSL